MRTSVVGVCVAFWLAGGTRAMHSGRESTSEAIPAARIDAVVGDTLKCFYESLSSAATPLRYNMVTVADQGRSYRLKWVYTPQPADQSFR